MHRASWLLFIVVASSILLPACARNRPLSVRYPSDIHVRVESKRHPDLVPLFEEAVIKELAKDESTDEYSKPGFPIAIGSEDGEYLLLLTVEEGEPVDAAAVSSEVAHVTVLASVWTRTNGDYKVWSRDLACSGPERQAAIRGCAALVSGELKSAQVKKGKRAGELGWEKKGK